MEEYIILAGLVVIAAVIAFIMLSSRPVTCQRRKEGGNTLLSITAKTNLNSVSVKALFDGEEVVFERKRVRKGQTIDFSFPYSEKKIRISLETESGKIREFEV